jgi:GTP cyclohydrolase II
MKISPAAVFPTKHGTFKIRVATDGHSLQHVIVYKGDMPGAQDMPLRVHSECITSEVFNSLRCDCNEQLESAMNYFETEGRGVLIYLRQEGRGIGLFNKIHAYSLQDRGMDTVEANEHLGLPVDARTYELAAEIIGFLGIASIRLLTNNPDKIEALRELGIRITDAVPVRIQPNSNNVQYLETKRTKMRHTV